MHKNKSNKLNFNIIFFNEYNKAGITTNANIDGSAKSPYSLIWGSSVNDFFRRKIKSETKTYIVIIKL